MSDNRKIQGGYYRAMDGQIRLLDGSGAERANGQEKESRRVELSFSSEAPYERWYGTEILCHDEGCIQLERLQEVGSLLFHHGRDAGYGSLPVGRILSVEVKDQRGTAVVEFDTDEKSELIYQKVKSGSIKGVSVGYTIGVYEEVKAGQLSTNQRFKGPCVVATRWEPIEISLEPTPADPSVGVGRDFENREVKTGMSAANEHNETIGRAEEAVQTVLGPGQAAVLSESGAEPTRSQGQQTEGAQAETGAGNPETDAQRAVSQERERISQIGSLCRSFGVDPAPYIGNGTTMEQMRGIVLEQLQQQRGGVNAANVDVVHDEEDKYRAAARDGLLMRMGFAVDKPADGAREFMGMSLMDLIKDAGARAGNSGIYRMEPTEAIRSAMAPDSAFLSIVDNTVGSVLSKAYQTAPTTFQSWTGKGSNPNFKASKRFRLSAAGEMVEIPQNGEFKNSEVSDEGVETRLSTYGKRFAFGRQAIINDDLGTIARAIQAQVRSCKRTINKKVYEALTGSGNIYDKKPLFHADHGNLGTAGELSISTIAELFQKMALQKDMSGQENLNISPRYLIVPVALQMTAYQLLHSTADPDASHAGVVNPLANRFEIICDGTLDGISAKSFYLAASPADVDTIEVSYLNGKEEPTMESNVAFDRLGVEYRIYHDFAVSVLDYRGLAKNAGK